MVCALEKRAKKGCDAYGAALQLDQTQPRSIFDCKERQDSVVALTRLRFVRCLEHEDGDYTVPVAWARTIHKADPKWDGIRYVSRQHNDGYALIGLVPGSRAVAVPICLIDGRTVAELAVSTITGRLPEERVAKVVQQMREQAALIGRQVTELSRRKLPPVLLRPNKFRARLDTP